MKAFGGVLFLLTMSVPSAQAFAQEDAEPHDPFWQNAYCINPRAPMSVRRSPTDGNVSLLFDISATGRPENIRVTAQQADDDKTGRLAAAMARSAKNALHRWEYFAYIKEGTEAARSDVSVTFHFRQSEQETNDLSREQTCLTGLVPVGPTHAGDSADPLINLKRCWRIRMPRQEDIEAKSARINVTFDVAKNGDVGNIRFADAQEENNFTKQVFSTLEKWKYHAFLVDGEPIARENLSLDFTFGDFPTPGGDKLCHHAPFGSSPTKGKTQRTEACKVTFDYDNVPQISRGCYK